MTLDELRLIETVIEGNIGYIHTSEREYVTDNNVVLALIKREIKLKTMDPRKNDISGNVMEND